MKKIYVLPLIAALAATTGCGQSKEEKTAEACGWVYASMAADKAANSKSTALNHVEGTLLEKTFDDFYATKNPDEADAVALLAKIGDICGSIEKSSSSKKSVSAEDQYCEWFKNNTVEDDYLDEDDAVQELLDQSEGTKFYKIIEGSVDDYDLEDMSSYIEILCSSGRGPS